MSRTYVSVFSVLLLIFTVSAVANAAPIVVDLTAGSAGNGSIGGVLYRFGADATGTGTGVFPSFVRVQATGTEKGYNTSARPVAFDETTDPNHTHDLQLFDLALVTLNTIDYYQFRLDMQESQGGGNEYLSFDTLKIYTSPTNFSDGNNPTDISLLGTLRYDMDASDVGNVVLMNSGLAPGQGKPDIVVFVPVSLFAAADLGDYIYWYTEFGGEGTVSGRKYGSSSAFEEWSFTASDVSQYAPEPTTVALLAVGGCGMLLGWRRRRRIAWAAATS